MILAFTLLTQSKTIEARAKHQVLIARWQIYKNLKKSRDTVTPFRAIDNLRVAQVDE